MARVKFIRDKEPNIKALSKAKSALDGALYVATDSGTMWMGQSDGTVFQIKDNIDSDTTYVDFVPATAIRDGESGLIPAPKKGQVDNYYLRSDGQWVLPEFLGLTYKITKNGDDIVLTGSDGSTSSVEDSNTTYTLASLGLTATAQELNYCDGLTGNIQTQIDNAISTNDDLIAIQKTKPTSSRTKIWIQTS